MSSTGAFSKAHYVAREDKTSRAGAVYIFSRLAAQNLTASSYFSSSTDSVCSENHDDDANLNGPDKRYYCPMGRNRGRCLWKESAKLTASDRRRGDLFGWTLSVDHESGLVVVGAPGSSLTGLWREVRDQFPRRKSVQACVGRDRN